MNMQTDSSANGDSNRSNRLKQFLRSTRTLIGQIGENAADIVADDMETSFSPEKPGRSKFRSFQIFLAVTVIGA